MKIIIDGRMAQYFGLGRFLQNLIINLAKIDQANEYVVLINSQDPILAKEGNFRFKRFKVKIPVYSPWEQLRIPFESWRERPDLFYSPNFNSPLIPFCPLVVGICDLIYWLYPEDCPSKLGHQYARFMLRRAAQRARVIVTRSRHSLNDIVRHLDVPEGKIVIVPDAVDNKIYRPMDGDELLRGIKKRYGIDKDFILYTGNHHPHKNLVSLVEAFSRLRRRKDYQLVIAGKRDYRRKDLFTTINKLGLEENIIFTDHVPEEELPSLYNAAKLFVFPSLYEGFGLPPLEAMACGTPVVTSNTSSLPEVVGEAAMMINPRKIEEITEAMETILDSPGLQKELSRKGIERAKLFSWEDAAKKMLKVFKQTI